VNGTEFMEMQVFDTRTLSGNVNATWFDNFEHKTYLASFGFHNICGDYGQGGWFKCGGATNFRLSTMKSDAEKGFWHKEVPNAQDMSAVSFDDLEGKSRLPLFHDSY